MLAAERLHIRCGAGMDARVETLLRLIPERELTAIAAAASGHGEARLVGPPEASDIVSAHGDIRTIGIVRVAGMVETAGRQAPWSAVAKVIDFNVEPPAMNLWVRPETEALVYEARLFADDGLGFRPARCHHISYPEPGVTVLWLEDLSAARRAPFDLEQLAQIARQLGEWNGHHLGRDPRLPFAPSQDSVARRWSDMDLAAQFRDFLSMRDSPEVVAMYGDHPRELAVALRDALLAFKVRAIQQPRTLCFGDCNIGNLFWLPGETVAVDWASLTLDPLGVDAGSVIGSAITWGRRAMDVARNEGVLFDCYLDGLRTAGWRGDRDAVRRGYLLHYGSYFLGTAIFPAFLKQFNRSRIELRAEAKWEELPAINAPLVELIPGLLQELEELR